MMSVSRFVNQSTHRLNTRAPDPGTGRWGSLKFESYASHVSQRVELFGENLRIPFKSLGSVGQLTYLRLKYYDNFVWDSNR